MNHSGMKPLFVIQFLALVQGAFAAHGAEQKPPWLQDGVIRAALDIGMTAEQSPHFKQALSNYFDNLNNAVHKLIRRNVTNLPREVRRKRNLYAKRMDAEVAEFLTQEQMPRYRVYRNLLLAEMSGTAPSESTENVEGPASHGQ